MDRHDQCGQSLAGANRPIHDFFPSQSSDASVESTYESSHALRELTLLDYDLNSRSRPSHSALREWDGDAQMDNTWITPDNWVGNVAPNPGDDLLFRSGARHPNNNNNFPPGTTFNTIELRGGGMGQGYNISGNSIALNAGIHVENNSGSPRRSHPQQFAPP